MISSIRTFLLVNLLVSLTLITSLAVIGNLFSEHHDFQNHLDSQLTLAAYTIDSFLTNQTDSDDYPSIQKRIEHFPKQMRMTSGTTQSKDLVEMLNSIQFQVWDDHSKLVLHSKNVPTIPLMDESSGFSNIWKNTQPWRIFTLSANSGKHIVVMQEHNFRIALEKRITRNSVSVMVLAYPLLGFLIWIIVGRGLSSISRVVDAIRKRDPHRLDPLRFNEEVPKEIIPLVKELNSLFSRLNETFLREKRFAADAAHELRTPLAALGAQAQVAMETKDPKQRKEALTKLLTGVKRSAHVVAQLLTMSRMVPDAQNAQFETIDLHAVAMETIADIAPMALAKDINLELQARPKMMIEGNAVSLGVMLRNLVDNAIRYTPEKGDIKVQIQRLTNKNILLSVIDNGPGVEEALRARIFERFYRVISTANEKGSGLGLGIVVQVAKMHNAKVSAKEPDSGQGLQIDVLFRSD